MLVLDTNVVSEAMRTGPGAAIDRWVREQAPEFRYTTSVTLAEIAYGTERLPEGRRKERLRAAARLTVAAFGDLILDFDQAAATAYAAVRTEREARGRPISVLDAQIAAICRVHRATLATRNVKDFDGLDLELVNPWEA